MRIKTNKTKVINTIIKTNINKEELKNDNIKEILLLKKQLKNTTIEYIETIQHIYNKFINFYYYSTVEQNNYCTRIMLKDAIKLILDSNLKINSFEYNKLKEWDKLNIL